MRSYAQCRVMHCVCVCVCVCEREGDKERDRQGQITVWFDTVLNTACVLQTHKSIITAFVTQLFPSWAWTDGKTKDIIYCLYIYFESWSSRLWKGALHFRCLHVVFGQSQCTGSVGQSEQTVLVGRRGFVEKHLREAGHRGTTIMYIIWKIMWYLNITACQHILLHQIHNIIIFKKASYDPFK